MRSSGSSEPAAQREHPRARPQPTHFPVVLKQERLARHLKQEVLAAQLHISERTLVSWETGARLPPVGMVLYLSRRLLGNERLDNDLMRAYLLDDLAWQLSLQQDEAILGDLQEAFVGLEQSNEAEQQETRVEHPLVLFEGSAVTGDGMSGKEHREGQVKALPGVAGKSGGDEAVLGLLAVLDALRREPSLVSVVLDFLREMGQGGSTGEGAGG
jgi:transcriptional regulator with XRE-family HTH domain